MSAVRIATSAKGFELMNGATVAIDIDLQRVAKKFAHQKTHGGGQHEKNSLVGKWCLNQLVARVLRAEMPSKHKS